MVKIASAARGVVELNRLFQKDRGKTANVARILSPNPIRRPLPCLLIQSFFYGMRAQLHHLMQQRPLVTSEQVSAMIVSAYLAHT